MKFTLEFDCDNAAFEESPEMEIAAILRRAARNVVEGYRQTAPCLDTNGNTVGRWRITDEEG